LLIESKNYPYDRGYKVLRMGHRDTARPKGKKWVTTDRNANRAVETQQKSMGCVERMDAHRASRMANIASNEMEDIQAMG